MSEVIFAVVASVLISVALNLAFHLNTGQGAAVALATGVVVSLLVLRRSHAP